MQETTSERFPTSVTGTQAAFLRLDPPEREILAAAAAIGAQFSIAQLARVSRTPRATVLRALQRAFEFDFFGDADDSDRVVFRAGLCDEVRRLTLVQFARTFHARIARDLERRRGDSALIAEHWQAAGRRAQVARHFEIAAETAFNGGNYGAATRHFHGAIAACDEGPESVRLHKRLARAVSRAGRPSEAVRILRERAELLERSTGASAPRHLAETLLDLSRALWNTCRIDDAVAVAERILTLASVPESVRDEARLWLAFGHAVANCLAPAEAALRPVRLRRAKIAPQLRLPLAEVEMMLAAKRGDVRAALHWYAVGIDVGQYAGPIETIKFCNHFIFEAGALSEGAEVADALARSLPVGANGSSGTNLILHLRLTLTDLALLRGRVREAREHFIPTTNRDDTGPRYRALEQAYGLALADLLDEPGGATNLVDSASVEAILQSREGRSIATVVVPQCEALLRLRRGLEAQELLGRALQAANGADVPFRLELLAARIGTTAALNVGRRSLRRAVALRADRLAFASLALFDAVVATRVGNRSARHARGAKEAAEIFREAGWRFHEAEALEYAGRTAEAADIYHASGAVRELRRLRLPTRRVALRRDLPLTERQREVCRLARDGATNATIAVRLGLSERTVAHHLSAGYARLGVRSRWQLTAAGGLD
jgi:DNA-binding CsgD family transcriptional regulator